MFPSQLSRAVPDSDIASFRRGIHHLTQYNLQASSRASVAPHGPTQQRTPTARPRAAPGRPVPASPPLPPSPPALACPLFASRSQPPPPPRALTNSQLPSSCFPTREPPLRDRHGAANGDVSPPHVSADSRNGSGLHAFSFVWIQTLAPAGPRPRRPAGCFEARYPARA